MKISIDGIGGAMSALQNLVSEEKLHNALAQAGEIVRAEAVMNCPVDTGRLRASIVSNVEGNHVDIGTNVEYGQYIEFGTGSKGDKSVAHTTKKHWTYYSGGRYYTTSGQAAKPFLVPALKNNIPKIVAAFKEGYRNG